MPLLFFLISSYSFAQVQILGGLYREKDVVAGKGYVEEIIVINRSKEAVEILLWLKDYKIDRGKDLFLKPETLNRSAGSWIEIKYPRFLLKAQRQANLKIPVTVPKEIEAGSYHCLLFIRPQPHIEESKNTRVRLNWQTIIQLVYFVAGGKKDCRIEEVKVEEDKLIIDVENIGDEVFEILTVKLELKNIEPKRMRLYPEQTNRVVFDISNLADKLHKDIRLILDDGDKYLKADRITFRKGIVPEELPLARIKTERISRRKGKPYSLYANLNYGSRQRGLSFSGSLRQGDFNLSLGSNYNQYFYGDVVNDFESYRVACNYSKSWFSAGFGSYIYSGKWTSMVRAGINFRSTRANVNYGLKYKVISLDISQRVFKKYFVRFHGFKSPYRKDWNLSLSIPIL